MTRSALFVSILFVLGWPAAHAQRGLNGFDVTNATVDISMILPGGPPRDGIPALTLPEHIAAEEADFLSDDDRVLGVALNGIVRAYPIMILNYHEIVNDAFGTERVAVTYCPLCGTGIVFDADVDGNVLSFGVSGLLYNSDVLMYDRETDSLWSQILASAVSGPMVGKELDRLPVRHTTWRAWRNAHPQTQVLSIDTGHSRVYYRDPYRGYADTSRIWFPVTNRDARLEEKAVVVGLEVDGVFKAYPFGRLPQGRTELSDDVGGIALTISYDRDAASAEVRDSNGNVIPTFTAFWFAWAAFHPETLVYGLEP